MKSIAITKDETLMLKGIAIVMMLSHHLFPHLPNIGTLPLYLLIFGKVCVAIFVLLSGYGLGMSYQQVDDRAEGGAAMPCC